VLRLTIRDEQGEITQTDQVLSGRGFLAGAYLEQRVGSTYAVPPVGSPHTSFAYDALGRPLRIAHPDGAERTLVYGSGFVDEADEEDTRTGPGATHTGTFTRRVLDATGRLRSIQERLAGRTIVSTYEYDVKGNLVAHTDALGRTVRTVYDCLGQVLAVQRPEQQTIAVLDAAGNVVEARSAGADRVFRTFDLANRPTAVAVGSAAAPPIIRYTYHDDGAPAPADAWTTRRAPPSWTTTRVAGRRSSAGALRAAVRSIGWTLPTDPMASSPPSRTRWTPEAGARSPTRTTHVGWPARCRP
jgi:YD repeat-containing protein